MWNEPQGFDVVIDEMGKLNLLCCGKIDQRFLLRICDSSPYEIGFCMTKRLALFLVIKMLGCFLNGNKSEKDYKLLCLVIVYFQPTVYF